MRLAPFIEKNISEIADEWVEHARDNISVTDEMELKQVRDHIVQMLQKIVNDMNTSQTDSQQESKSKGNNSTHKKNLAAEEHGAQRVDSGFDIVQLSSEFRALRATVIRLWEQKMPAEKGEESFQDLMRFNEAIDEAWLRSLERFDRKVDESKNWFQGMTCGLPLQQFQGCNKFFSCLQTLKTGKKKSLSELVPVPSI